MKISINAQSSIKVVSDKNIYFDPYLVTEENHDADVILITHEHHDHFDPESIAKIAKEDTVYVAPASMYDQVRALTAYDECVVPLGVGERYEVLGIPVETVASYNPAKQFHPRENNWIGYVAEIEGKKIYVTGDMDVTPEAKAVKCDILMLPIGGKFTMDAEEAAELANCIKPPKAIPTHYGGIVGSAEDAAKFASLVGPETEVEIIL